MASKNVLFSFGPTFASTDQCFYHPLRSASRVFYRVRCLLIQILFKLDNLCIQTEEQSPVHSIQINVNKLFILLKALLNHIVLFLKQPLYGNESGIVVARYVAVT